MDIAGGYIKIAGCINDRLCGNTTEEHMYLLMRTFSFHQGEYRGLYQLRPLIFGNSILVLRCSLLKEEGTDKWELSNTRNLQTEQSSSQPIFQMREQYIRLDGAGRVNTTYNWKLMIYRALESAINAILPWSMIMQRKDLRIQMQNVHQQGATLWFLYATNTTKHRCDTRVTYPAGFLEYFLVSLLLLKLLLIAACWCSMYFTVHR